MPEILTESFCERCGTRYTFEAAAPARSPWPSRTSSVRRAAASVMPFDEGIHRTRNPAAGTTLMVSIYGRPLRRLYMQCYNLESGHVDRRYPPHMKKRMLAEQALAAMGKESGA